VVRIAQIIATTAILLLLTWLWLSGMNTGSTTDDALRALDELAIADSALHRDVLSARVGILRNYDPLVREINTLRDSIARLRATATHDPELSAAIDRLATLVDQQEQWTEQFKTDNALLQNSLAYFRLFSTRLVAADQGGILVRRVGALATALLQLTLDTSPAASSEVDDRLASIPVRGLAAGNSAEIEPLLAHARMLRNLLPATDTVVKALFAVPGEREQEGIHALVLSRTSAARKKAELFRYVLYAVSLLLVGSLVCAGIRLQSRAVTLRRRAAIERVIAGISTRFINSRPHEIAAHVQDALAELAEWIGADRGYFVVADQPAGVYKWCRAGMCFRGSWPEAAPALASHFSSSSNDGAVQIHDVSKLPHGSDRDALFAADLHGWLCIPSTSEQRLRALLGFDALRPGPMTRYREFGLLRMAFDAIANALDRQSLERDRERLEANLQHARRMETIGALASGIAHNFNNIIGAILGYAETAQTQVHPGTRSVESLTEIRRAGERARDLVDQILTFGRRSDARKTRICVEALVAEAKSLLDVSLSPYVNIVIGATSQRAIVFGEPAQLQQVILNVCNNAAQAMDAPGSIEIEVGVQQLEQGLQTEHGNLVPGPYAVISVTDPGRGMDEMTLERIFEPFFSTRVGGNGLGLATVRESVVQHGGGVKVRSTPGAGTRFDIWLPCVTHVESLPTHEVHEMSVRGAGETVLVLDADRERLLRDEEILAALGYEPVGFTHPAEAVAACSSEPTRFDAALLCCPPHGASNVVDHTAALHESAPNLPVIVATASAREFGAPYLAGVGVSAVIRQPLTSAELAGALASCLLLK
jgi:signal transduction histidine kinase